MLNKLSIIGKAFYHIFLIQILYFLVFSFTIFNDKMIFGSIIEILADVALCLILGLGFFYLEKYIKSFKKFPYI